MSQQLSISITLSTLEAFFTSLHRHVLRALANRRPWAELIDRTWFSRPGSFSEAAFRVRKNLHYFRTNYLIVLALVLAVFLLSHPFSLLLLISLTGAWLFLYVLRPADQQLVIFRRSFTDCEALVGLSLVTVVVVLVTSVVSLLLWAFIMGLGIVCAHGAVRVPEDLFLDEQEPWASGLLQFVGSKPMPVSGIHVGSVTYKVFLYCFILINLILPILSIIQLLYFPILVLTRKCVNRICLS